MNTCVCQTHLSSGKLLPPRYLSRVPLPGEKSLVRRSELDQPLHVLLGHCRWRSKVKAHLCTSLMFTPSAPCLLTFIGVFYELRQRAQDRLHGGTEGGGRPGGRGGSVLVFRPDAN